MAHIILHYSTTKHRHQTPEVQLFTATTDTQCTPTPFPLLPMLTPSFNIAELPLSSQSTSAPLANNTNLIYISASQALLSRAMQEKMFLTR
jgi:hypothetical protein